MRIFGESFRIIFPEDVLLAQLSDMSHEIYNPLTCTVKGEMHSLSRREFTSAVRSWLICTLWCKRLYA